MSKELVGKAHKPWVFPVKGMQGVEMDTISARSVSAVGDRRVAFSEVRAKRTPTLLDTTQYPGLLRYSTRFEDQYNPKESRIIVTTPEGKDLYIDDPYLLQQISDESRKNLELVRMGRGLYHSMPISAISVGSIAETSTQAGYAEDQSIDPRAFRMNLNIETVSGNPYEEDRWLGSLLTFGDRKDSAMLVAVKLDKRCATVNYHPETAKTNPSIMRAIVQNHGGTLGIYCSIVREGTIEANDPVYATPLPEL